jgi:hypothetical protein
MTQATSAQSELIVKEVPELQQIALQGLLELDWV